MIRKMMSATAAVLIALSASVVLAAPPQVQSVTIQHAETGRYVDAHVTAGQDYRIVTLTLQDNSTQRWTLVHRGGGVFTIKQVSSGRFWDAYEGADRDYGLVTRTYQNNDTQRWRLIDRGEGIHTIQQVKSGRFVDAHVSADQDFRIVTRTFQDNDTQRWRIRRISSEIKNCLPVVGCFRA